MEQIAEQQAATQDGSVQLNRISTGVELLYDPSVECLSLCMATAATRAEELVLYSAPSF